MFSKAPRRVTAELDVIPFTFEAPPADLNWVVCSKCQAPLALHQLDMQSPFQLVGTCHPCSRWYLIAMEPGMGSALMVVMPENRLFQAAWDAHAGPEGSGQDSLVAGS